MTRDLAATCADDAAESILKPMRFEKSSSAVFTPLDDGTGVLLNTETLFYYTVNRTGAALWKQIEANGPVSVGDLVRSTCERYDIEEDAARQEVGAFVDKLKQMKVVHTIV